MYIIQVCFFLSSSICNSSKQITIRFPPSRYPRPQLLDKMEERESEREKEREREGETPPPAGFEQAIGINSIPASSLPLPITPTPHLTSSSFALILKSDAPSLISTSVLPPFPTPFASAPPVNSSPTTPFIPISKDEYEALCAPWKLCIIIKVIGKSFAREFLDKELAKIWGWKHQANLIALGKGFYSIKCSSIDEKASVLANGPWCIQNHHVWV